MHRIFARVRADRGVINVEYVLIIVVSAAIVGVLLKFFTSPAFADAVHDFILRNVK